MSLKRTSNDDLVTTSGLNTKTTKDNTSTSTIVAAAGIIMEQELKPPPVDERTTMDFEVTQTTATTTNSTAGERDGIVYVVVDGLMSQILEIKVKQGDSIPTIQEKIKSKGSPAFDSVPVFSIHLFLFKKQMVTEFTKPLDATMKWNSEVTWGTVEQPLLVYTPKAINSGKCTLLTMISVCDFVHVYVSNWDILTHALRHRRRHL